MKFEKKELPKSQIEIKVTIDEKEFEGYHAKAFAAIQKEIEIDGFRKGNAPEDVVVKKYGDMIILEEMGNLALRDAYVKAIDEHALTPIAQPQVTITKIAKGNPFEATIVISVMPEVTLPSYTKIAKEVVVDEEPLEIKEADVEKVLEELRKGRATYNNHEHHDHHHDTHEGHDHAHHDHHDHDHTHDHEGHDHTHDDHAHSHHETKNATLPELNDEFAQSFGDSFKTLDDLKKKIGENLKLEREQKNAEKKRTAIIEALIKETKADLPDAMVEGELASMMAQFKGDITRFGGTWDDYLKHANKTEDEIKASWRDDAIKRAMTQLVLHKIAEVEKLHATEAEVEAELVRLLAQVQDADEERARAYLHQALTNDKVLRFLSESSK